MAFSLAIAFIVTPWASIRVLHWGKKYSLLTAGAAPTNGVVHAHSEHPEDFFTRFYRRFMSPLLAHRRWRYLFLASVVGLLLVAMALVGVGFVKVKMLPFDNKSEFQVMIDMPDGTPLEQATRVAQALDPLSWRPSLAMVEADLYGGEPERALAEARRLATREQPHREPEHDRHDQRAQQQEPRDARAQVARRRVCRRGSSRHWPTVPASLKIGRYIAMMRPPTTTPRNAIMTGSISEVRPATAASTSSS